uniref:Hexose transporter 1 n=1 Tax=Alexandrium andersonii TaxID=327968 RepID=A0A7S2HWS1_9DINO
MNEAKATLHRIRSDEEAEQEMKEIVAEYEESKQHGDPRWSEVFTGRVGRLVLLGASLQMLQQLVGMNAFMYFGPRIFGSFGLKENRFQTINNAVNFVSTLPALYLADRSGRTVLLIIGAAGMGIACTVMGVLGLLFMDNNGGTLVLTNQSVGGFMMAMVFGFVVNFACTWGPIVWVYCCEIFPLKYRGRCVGVTTVTNWVGNYIIAQFSPVLLESLGFGTFFIFGGFSFIGLALALWLPETKGLMLEHIGPIFDKKFGIADSKEAPLSSKGVNTYGTTILIESSSKLA